MSIPSVFIIIIITMLFIQGDSESHVATPKKVNIMKKKDATQRIADIFFFPIFLL